MLALVAEIVLVKRHRRASLQVRNSAICQNIDWHRTAMDVGVCRNLKIQWRPVHRSGTSRDEAESRNTEVLFLCGRSVNVSHGAAFCSKLRER